MHAHLNALGEQFRGGVRDIAAKLDVPLQATGAAHMFGLHWTPTPVVDFDATQTSDRTVISQLILALVNEGYLMFRAGTATLSAPMTHDEIDGVLAALESAIRGGGYGG